jgi:hypothetical protein
VAFLQARLLNLERESSEEMVQNMVQSQVIMPIFLNGKYHKNHLLVSSVCQSSLLKKLKIPKTIPGYLSSLYMFQSSC